MVNYMLQGTPFTIVQYVHASCHILLLLEHCCERLPLTTNAIGGALYSIEIPRDYSKHTQSVCLALPRV